jgi:hypothetical protein
MAIPTTPAEHSEYATTSASCLQNAGRILRHHHQSPIRRPPTRHFPRPALNTLPSSRHPDVRRGMNLPYTLCWICGGTPVTGDARILLSFAMFSPPNPNRHRTAAKIAFDIYPALITSSAAITPASPIPAGRRRRIRSPSPSPTRTCRPSCKFPTNRSISTAILRLI